MSKKVKLHLGCGNIHIDDFINIDIRHMPGVDRVDNIRFLRAYRNDSVDLIYSSHVLEHFSRWEYENVLRRWCEVLKPNGMLRLAIPDFEAIVAYYNKTKDLKALMGLLYGGQDYEQNFHHCIFDYSSIEASLLKVGFYNISVYDWRGTGHAHIDDCSQAYLPHMDKNDGTLMSLNVKAFKI